jgi:hypothetical protein
MTTTAPTAPATAVATTVITNLDATPAVRTTAGQGAPSGVQRVIGVNTFSVNQATTVLTRFVRIPSNAIVQSVKIACDTAASTSLVGNWGLWFSDTADGTTTPNQGVLTAISSAFFADTITFTTFNVGVTTPFAPVDITFGNAGGTNYDACYLPSRCIQPVWQAVYNSLVGLTTNAAGAFTTASGQHYIPGGGSTMGDPGGYFDIGCQLTSTGVNTSVVKAICIVDFVIAAS